MLMMLMICRLAHHCWYQAKMSFALKAPQIAAVLMRKCLDILPHAPQLKKYEEQIREDIKRAESSSSKRLIF